MIRVSIRLMSGCSVNQRTALTTVSLISPLAKLTSASLENSRLNPSMGLILDSFGLIGSTESTGMCWTRLPATPKARSTNSGTSAVRRIEPASPEKKAPNALPPTSYWSAFAISSLRLSVSAPLEGMAMRPKRRPEAASMNQVVTSWLLTTSPFLRASSSFFCEGSSVFEDFSGASSLMR